jgi:hypothetical protein
VGGENGQPFPSLWRFDVVRTPIRCVLAPVLFRVLFRVGSLVAGRLVAGDGYGQRLGC